MHCVVRAGVMAAPALRATADKPRLILSAALVLPLVACMVGPDFGTPPAPVAGKFIGANNRTVRSGLQEYPDWWKAFRDPTLNRLIEVAYNQNLTLLSAGTRVLQARAALGIAIGELYPQVQQGTGSLIYTRTSAATPLAPPDSSPQHYWTDALALQAAWELDFWGKFRRGVESADAVYLASIATYDDVLVSLVGDVAVTYIAIRTTEQLLEITRSTIVKDQQALEIAQARFSAGDVSELDVFQSQNVLSAHQASIPQLQIQLDQALNALCVLLGVPPKPLGFFLSRSKGKIPLPPPIVTVGIPADLLRRRPDIRAAELRALAQSAQIGIAEAQLLPAISITGSFGGSASTANGHNLGQIFKSTGMTYSAGPGFQWNILNYGQITNNVRLQDAALQQLLVDYQNSVLKAQQEVDNGIAAFVQSRVQVGYLNRSVSAANGALRLSLDQYNAGTSDYTTVLVSQQNLYTAETNLAVALGNVALGLTAIYRALGGGWQIRVDSNFVWASTVEEMRARTDWGRLLPPVDEPQPPAPGLPAPEDIGPVVRPPEW